MASTSSINSPGNTNANLGQTHHNHAPHPPPRTHSRPSQPPPPPPLPLVPPVPPTRDSSIIMSRVAIGNSSKASNQTSSVAPPPPPPPPPQHQSLGDTRHHVLSSSSAVQQQPNISTTRLLMNHSEPSMTADFLSQFIPLFKPLDELPPPEPFKNKPKTYPSQKAQHKQSIRPTT